jgi:protein gp37
MEPLEVELHMEKSKSAYPSLPSAMQRKIEIFTKSEKAARKDSFNNKFHNMNWYMYEWTPEKLYKELTKIENLMDNILDEALVVISNMNRFG